MSRNLTLGLVALIAVVALVLLWRGSGSSDRPTQVSSDSPASTAGSGRAAEARPDTYSRESGLSHDDDPVGVHRLEGQVVDSDDLPVAGATVVIDANPRREARTEEDGSFGFDKLMARSYLIEARNGDAIAGPMRATLSASSDPVVLRLRAAASLEIVATDAATREPISGAMVELRGLAVVTETTDSEGIARIKGVGAGTLSLKLSAAGYASSFQLITSPGTAGTVVTRRYALRPGVTVSGTTHDASGQPVEGARVWPEQASAQNVAPDERLDAVITDAKGRWRIAGLPRATVRFRASHPRFAPSASQPINLADGVERTDVAITLAVGARVAGRVVDQQQHPVAGALVRVGTASMNTAFVRQAYSDAEGSFEVSGLPRTAMQLVAMTEDASSPLVNVNLSGKSEAVDVVIPLDGAERISGLVVTTAGEPVPEARIVANPEITGRRNAEAETRLRGDASVVADADGNFVLTGLRPGEYRLRATAPGAPTSVLTMRQGALIATKTTDAKIVVDDLTRARGVVSFPDGSHPGVFSVAVGAGTRVTFAGTDGVFELTDVPAGTSFLTVVGPELVRQFVEKVVFDAGKDNDLGTVNVQRGRRITGRVTSQSGSAVEGAMVYATPDLNADGREIASFWEESDDMKRAITDANGSFTLRGVGPGTQVVVADHLDVGRSQLVALGAGNKDAQLALVMQEVGSLEGRIMINGKPVEGGVGARPAEAADSQFAVGTGPDGHYRLDRLTPGDYVAYSWFSAGREISGGTAHTTKVTIKPGETTRLDIDVEVGEIEVTLFMDSETTPPVQFGYGILVGSVVSEEPMSLTINEARAMMADRGDIGSINEGVIVDNRRITFSGLTAGRYSACASPFGGDPRDPEVLQGFQKNTVEQRMYCEPVTVAESPKQQEVKVTVEAPPAP